MSTRDSATEAGPPGSPEPDGEASYLNALLTTIAKGPRAEIILTSEEGGMVDAGVLCGRLENEVSNAKLPCSGLT